MKSLNQKWITAALVGTACLLSVATTQAAQFILRAAPTTKTMPDGRVVPMWGFAQETTFGNTLGAVTVPGPALLIGNGDGELRIVLDNRLAEGISLVIPGLPPPIVRSNNANGITLTGQTRTSLPSDVDVDNLPLGWSTGGALSPGDVDVNGNGVYDVADGDVDNEPLGWSTGGAMSPGDIDQNANGLFDLPRDRARSFVAETPPNNQFVPGGPRVPVVYIWSIQPGTYLYHSGSHAALQVQMGLYGSIRKRNGANEAYEGVSFNQNLDVTLLFSEVDADLHDAVANGQYGPGLQVPSTIHSNPQYYLINGNAYNPGSPLLSRITLSARPTATRPALLRLINAGQDMRVPIIDRAEVKIIAEDARTNSYPKSRYSVQLPALKTVDALWTQTSPGTFALYDRRLGLSNGQQPSGGMLVNLVVP